MTRRHEIMLDRRCVSLTRREHSPSSTSSFSCKIAKWPVLPKPSYRSQHCLLRHDHFHQLLPPSCECIRPDHATSSDVRAKGSGGVSSQPHLSQWLLKNRSQSQSLTTLKCRRGDLKLSARGSIAPFLILSCQKTFSLYNHASYHALVSPSLPLHSHSMAVGCVRP